VFRRIRRFAEVVGLAGEMEDRVDALGGALRCASVADVADDDVGFRWGES
jgi:hypothetical protein